MSTWHLQVELAAGPYVSCFAEQIVKFGRERNREDVCFFQDLCQASARMPLVDKRTEKMNYIFDVVQISLIIALRSPTSWSKPIGMISISQTNVAK